MIDPSPGWSITPLPVEAAAIALALFARGFARLRRRAPRHARPWRAGLFVLAVALGLAATISPLHEAGEQGLLAAHMLEHVTIGDLVPALLLVAVRGPLLGFVVPAPAIRAVTRRRRVRAALGALLAPPLAVALWAASLAAWHIPRAYDAAAASPTLHIAQHASFFLGGALLWAVLVDPARRGSAGTGARLGVALAAFTAGQLLATTLVLAQHPLFSAYAGPSGLLGLSPLDDQATAGLVMMAEQLLTLGAFTAFALRRHLDETVAQPSADPLVRALPRPPVAR